MSILESIKRLGARGKAPQNAVGKKQILDRDREGRALREEDILAFLREEYDRRKNERLPLERSWTLNANFYAGNQHCGLNEESGEIQPYAPLRDYEEQGAYNRIAPLIETRIASLRTLTYAMTVRPHTNEAEDSEKSEIATALLRHTQSASDFPSKRDAILGISELYGTAFVLSYWDRDGGEVILPVMENADTRAPIGEEGGAPADTEKDGEEKKDTLPDGADADRSAPLPDGKTDTDQSGTPLSPDGAPAPDRAGEIGYGILTPYEVFPDDLSRPSIGDQRSILFARVMSVADIADTYGVTVRGGTAEVYGTSAAFGGILAGQGGAVLTSDHVSVQNAATVLTYMERPSAHHKEGRLIIATEDRLLWYGPLPYAEIPLVAFKCKEVVGQFFGRSVITDLIPLQRAYNGVKNKIHDYIRAVAANPMLVPEGSIPDIAEFAAHGLPPGEIVEYNAERGRPEPLSPAPLPAELRYECERLAADMEYTAGVSQLMVVGKTPSGVTSGTAIENLRRIDNARLALTGENLRHGVYRLAVIWLSIYKQYLTGRRTLALAGRNAAAGVLSFSAEDINSFDVVFDTENELLVSPETQKENFLAALKLGLFQDEEGRLPRSVKARAKRLLQVGGEADLVGCDELQMEAAARENAAALLGERPTLSPFDDHELHIEMHKKCLLQARFAYFRKRDPEGAAAFEEHLLAHMLHTEKGKEKPHVSESISS